MSSRRSVDGNVLDPDQRVFLGAVEGLQMTDSSRLVSRTDLNMIDETRGSITVEEGDLLVNEKTIDRQSHTHPSLPNIKSLLLGRLIGRIALLAMFILKNVEISNQHPFKHFYSAPNNFHLHIELQAHKIFFQIVFTKCPAQLCLTVLFATFVQMSGGTTKTSTSCSTTPSLPSCSTSSLTLT